METQSTYLNQIKKMAILIVFEYKTQCICISTEISKSNVFVFYLAELCLYLIQNVYLD